MKNTGWVTFLVSRTVMDQLSQISNSGLCDSEDCSYHYAMLPGEHEGIPIKMYLASEKEAVRRN